MNTKQKSGAQFGQQINKKKQTDCAVSSNSDDSEDEVEQLQVLKKNTNKQRFSVSAEAYGWYNKKENFKPKIIHKTPEQKQRIDQRMMQGFMFNSLDDQEREIVINAMEEKRFNQNEFVIRQGEEGNVLFVVDVGELDCFKNYGDGVDKYLKTYIPGESFGELALLFQSPRAASIKVKSANAILWQLDRETFNIIVKESSIKKREKYESFLMKWDLLKIWDDDPYEKLKISDALFEKHFKKGDVLLQEGQKFNEIFIIDQGSVILEKKKQVVLKLQQHGQYFGTVSITLNQPEPFTYIAETDLKLYHIPRKSYTTTLKALEDLLQKNIKDHYQKFL
ncbi:hypothetical protein pb186bvf_015953 [Paramecium bursaria]